MIDPLDLSRWEHCARLPLLYRTLIPPRRPVREAIRDYFSRGLGADAFLDEAATQGFDYHAEGEPYTLAQDFASWLDGALRIAAEIVTDAIQLYRIAPSDDMKWRWPELLERAANPESPIQLHTLRLPTIRNGRLPSPLNLAYEHPVNGLLRVARRDNEAPFSKSWKRVGRWERPDIGWKEWRRGIELDQAESLIHTIREVPQLDAVEREAVRADARATMAAIDSGVMPPRLREGCQGCTFKGWCHGSASEREEFLSVSVATNP